MSDGPSTVFIRHRPIRTAFLVDTARFEPGSALYEKLLDSVVDFNHTTWGGRTNLILFPSAENLTVDDWQQLELSDPDCIKSFSPIPTKLLNQLDERIAPWSIALQDVANTSNTHVESFGVSVPPAPDILRELGSRQLLMFEFEENCSPIVRRFLHRNFGTFSQWVDSRTQSIRRMAWLENLLPKLDVLSYRLSDIASLGPVLRDIAGNPPGRGYRRPHPFTAPCELSSAYTRPSRSSGDLGRGYWLFIGDAPEDFWEFWNGVQLRNNWTAPYKSQLWLPSELARDALLQDSLRNWLIQFVGNAGDREIVFVSKSLSSDEVDRIRHGICSRQSFLHGRVIAVDALERSRRALVRQQLEMNRNYCLSEERRGATRYSITSEQETFPLVRPDILQKSGSTDPSWMVDLQIEQVSRHRPMQREQSWWILPRRSSGGLLHPMFKAPSRIARNGQFSVLLETRTPWLTVPTTPELTIHLPDEQALFSQLIVDPHYRPFHTADVRYKRLPHEHVFDGVRISDKGDYLAGLIGLFGDFWTARAFCERRFWTDFFLKLSNRDARTDTTLRTRIQNVLRKSLKGGTETEKVERLADRILIQVGGRLRTVYMSFVECEELRAKTASPATAVLRQGAKSVSHQGIAAVTEEDMREGLDDLLALGVLRLGVESRCPRCRVSTWHHVDDLRQNITCPGCDQKYALRANEPWCYSLNTLAQMAISQGVLGVLHALTALASPFCNSFLFSPSLELYRCGSKEPWHEIDVVCVVDGELVIGEVKEGPVSKIDFDELVEIARVVRPERTAMFLPQGCGGRNVQGWLSRAQEQLEPARVRAEIFELPKL